MIDMTKIDFLQKFSNSFLQRSRFLRDNNLLFKAHHHNFGKNNTKNNRCSVRYLDEFFFIHATVQTRHYKVSIDDAQFEMYSITEEFFVEISFGMNLVFGFQSSVFL